MLADLVGSNADALVIVAMVGVAVALVNIIPATIAAVASVRTKRDTVELQRNSGASVADSVARIESKVDDLERRFNVVIADAEVVHRDLRDRDDAILARLLDAVAPLPITGEIPVVE